MPGNKAVAAVKANPGKTTGISAAILAMIAATMALEGGYVNHPNDPGGETNRGITKAVAVKHGYTGPMRALPEDVATSIYYADYIVKPGFGPLSHLDAPVTTELYDTGTNMGPYWPSLFLQQAINDTCAIKVKADGKVGPATIKAFSQCQSAIGASRFCVMMLDALDARQKARYDYLVRVNPRLRVFHRGWINHRIGNVDRKKCGRTSP
ncbi:secretion activating protein [Sphingobium phenoxybenzoativorans]|uniref:Secretion activating protein n=1 Tax=Sphingobium phenoxybenzoativorans TaxID=1592790 RepID=A0A975PZU9_9SPHN|nr:N-acetylmuramidase [Sphingobium phenoxybenzoativorans]QUT04061.1 secretion activating protein [Sphingobium phenoxybenzoativorans]